MSDSTQQWILKPGHRIAFPENTPKVAPGHYVMVLAPGEDVRGSITTIQRTSFEKHFQLLDIPAIQKQLEGHLASFIVNVTEYVDLCDHAQNANDMTTLHSKYLT